MIVIVDYKTANLGSIVNIFKRIGVPARVAEKPAEMNGATHLVLPGIGHFDTCARNLRESGFSDALQEPALHGHVPLLGICVGAQLLTLGSEEGNEPGLGWVDAETLRFPDRSEPDYKIPHMGWNHVTSTQEHPLFSGFREVPRFYFVHSYFMSCHQPESNLASTHHGLEFSSAIVKGNVAGVQFHPEKSHKFGMQLLRNFAQANATAGICGRSA